MTTTNKQLIDAPKIKDEAFGIFAKRSSGTTPKLVKLVGDKIYYMKEDATEALTIINKEYPKVFEVRRLLVQVLELQK